MKMRIACLHLPSFVLQVHVRAAPHLAGTAFAVVGEDAARRDVPRIHAVSRAAAAAGVRPGMTGTQARAVAPAVRLVDAAPERVTGAMRALAEAALALSVTVDVETPGAIYALVPPRQREAAFAERLAHAATQQGLVGRVGVADDRFTAGVAARAARAGEAAIVPRRGSAAFLAPLALDRLPLDADVVHMLELLGVKTVGDFAALPPPSVGRRWSAGGVDAQALARGEDPRPLVAYLPVAPVCERLELEAEIAELEPLAFVLRPLFERAALRLAGRGRAAERVAVRLGDGRGAATEIAVAPSLPTTSSRTLLDLARAHLAERRLQHGVAWVEVEVMEEGEPAPAELELFPTAGAADPAAADVAVARLRAVFGADVAVGVALADRHRPEGAYQSGAFSPVPRAPARRRRRKSVRPVVARAAAAAAGSPLPTPGRALRLLDPPVAAGDDLVARLPRAPAPLRLEGEWWTEAPFARDYFQVAGDDGARYWVYRDHRDGQVYLHGVID